MGTHVKCGRGSERTATRGSGDGTVMPKEGKANVNSRTEVAGVGGGCGRELRAIEDVGDNPLDKVEEAMRPRRPKGEQGEAQRRSRVPRRGHC